MPFHPEILRADQQKLLAALGPWATARGFYLAGGTALALHLGHRESADFDWFGPDPILDPAALVREIETTAKAAFQPTQRLEPGTVVGLVSQVKASFFRYQYALLDATVDFGPCVLASLRDLAAMKLSAIYDRGSKRDFIDVHALLGDSGLAYLIAQLRAKYPQGSVPHLLRALEYFDDAQEEPMPRMSRRVAWAAVKRKLAREVAAYGG